MENVTYAVAPGRTVKVQAKMLKDRMLNAGRVVTPEMVGGEETLRSLVEAGFVECIDTSSKEPAKAQPGKLVDPFAKDKDPGGIKMDHDPAQLRATIEGSDPDDQLALLHSLIEDKNQLVVDGAEHFAMPESVDECIALLSADFEGDGE